VRKKAGGQAYALTFPLLTTASGAKFGKSEKGAIYLDPELTSIWDFYQYWINVDDRDVVKLLQFFTFRSQEEIEALAARVAEAPHLREAQKLLAEDMTTLIHGTEELAKVQNAVAVLFGSGDVTSVDADTLRAALDSAPGVSYPKGAIPPLPQILADLELVKSKGQARKDIAAGAVRVNMQQIKDPAFTPAQGDFLHDEILLVKKGKKHWGLVTLS